MSAERLSARTLAAVAGKAEVPGYERCDVTAGVVHIGLGAFARAHVAVYCDDLLGAGGVGAGIVGVSLRSSATRDALTPQDGLYTVIEVDGRDAPRLRVVGSVTGVSSGPEAAVAALARPESTTVTLTVTEKGYGPRAPTPGVLVEGLRRRRAADLGGLAILSCDNLPSNGRATAGVVTQLAAASDAGLADWIAATCVFPSTVVDRVVPATGATDRALVAERLGLHDEWPVRAEPFRQWVIERAPGLPAWDTVGAQVVDDVRPWEDLKLRLLNGPHSALAYLGLRAGIDTITDAVADPVLGAFVTALAEEVAPTLACSEPEARAYAAAVRARFANPAIGHTTSQTAMDGSQKLPHRIVAPLRELLAAGERADHLTLVVAAWMAHVAGGRTPLVDPLATRLTAAVRSASSTPAGTVGALLGVTEVFDPDLAADPMLRRALERSFALLTDGGAHVAIADLG